MDMDRLRQLLLETVRVGLAVAEPDSQRIAFMNPQFGEWFPTAAVGGALDGAVPKFPREAALAALARGESWIGECEVKMGRRAVSLGLQLAPGGTADSRHLMLQALNITKVKELEYMIESYSRMIERQNRDLKKEKERVEKLLLNIMPKQVYEEWKVFGVTAPQRFDQASILMLDFVNSTQMAVSQDPPKLIAELNDIFTAFDRIVEQFGCERLKTQGDAYVAVSGIPDPTPDHARNIANVALRFLHYLKRRNRSSEFEWRCRIGINTGSVIGSIVGVQKYVYDIFGPGVNLAARMESACEPMEITLCEDMAPLLERDFRLAELGEAEVRGFGVKRLYRLLSALDANRIDVED